MRTHRFAFVLILALASSLAVPLAAQNDGRAFQPEDWYRLTTLSDPAMSPDGRMVAFTVMTVDEEENCRHREVWLVPTSGGDPVRLTSPGVESSNPRWSHDGRYLFFTSDREGGGEDGEGRTWALQMDRAAAGEAIQLENWPSGSIPASGAFDVFTDEPGDEEAEGDEGDDAEDDGDPFGRMPATARPPYRAITAPADPLCPCNGRAPRVSTRGGKRVMRQ